jgi:plasmid maintenance system antidote protein VapI
MAIRLDKAFGGGAETWLRVQAAFDLAQVLKSETDIRVDRLTRVDYS